MVDRLVDPDKLGFSGGCIQHAERICLARRASQRARVDHARPADALIPPPVGVAVEDKIKFPGLNGFGQPVRPVAVQERDAHPVPFELKLRRAG